jgi:DNA primase
MKRPELINVVSKYVKLKEKGNKHVGLCPFHKETKPSFTADKQKQLFHCFGCGIGGDVITFLREIKKI